MKKRKLIIRLFGLLILGIIVFIGCKPSTPTTIKIGYLPIAECTPLFVAQSEKFFEKAGLKIELVEFDAGPTVISAALGGSLDGGLSGVTPIFFAADKDKPIKMVSDGGHVIPAEHPYLGIVVPYDSKVKSVEELKQKIVAINGFKTIEDALLSVALNKANISKDVKVIALPHPNMMPALKNGTIDASMAIEPYISMGLSSGQIRVLTGSEDIIPSFQISAIFFTDKFINENPETVEKFMTAYNQAIDFINQNPVRSREIVAEWTKTPIETAKLMTLPGWSKELDIDAVKKAQQAMLENHILERPKNLESYFYKKGQK